MKTPKLAFTPERFKLNLDQIVPVREMKESYKHTHRYKTILMSIKSVGIIEPLVVFQQSNGAFWLMDGHLRLLVARDLGMETVECIASTEDESYTYNAKINRIAPIQEHKMIMKAIKNGVSSERIAKTLNRTQQSIEANKQLLVGLAPEAIDIIKDKKIAIDAIKVMKRVKPVRQVEMASMMQAVNNYTGSYARAILHNTPTELVIDRERRKRKMEPKPEQLEDIGRDIAALITNSKTAEDSYGERMLQLSFIRGYVKRLLENAKIVRYLTAKHIDILTAFEDIAATETLVTA